MELDLYEVLGSKPKGTRVYSPLCGELLLKEVTPNGVFCGQPDRMEDEYNLVFMSDGHLKNYGKWNDYGECMLFPSSGMRDWYKFCWKRGDVVTDIDRGITAIFDGWANDGYTEFNTIYSYEAEDSSYNEECIYSTDAFEKVSDGDRLRFIAYLEKEYHGKFNADTSEIEKTFEPKNGDFICFVDEDSERHYAIFKSMDNQWLKYHAFVDPNGTWFNCNSAFGRTFNERENIFRLRLATATETIKLLSSLAKHGKRWNAEKLCVEELQNTKKNEVQFKPFDKVLARGNGDDFWTADFFSYVTTDFSNNMELYVCVGDSYYQCIPYEGNESLLGTTEPYNKEKGH